MVESNRKDYMHVATILSSGTLHVSKITKKMLWNKVVTVTMLLHLRIWAITKQHIEWIDFIWSVSFYVINTRKLPVSSGLMDWVSRGRHSPGNSHFVLLPKRLKGNLAGNKDFSQHPSVINGHQNWPDVILTVGARACFSRLMRIL